MENWLKGLIIVIVGLLVIGVVFYSPQPEVPSLSEEDELTVLEGDYFEEIDAQELKEQILADVAKEEYDIDGEIMSEDLFIDFRAVLIEIVRSDLNKRMETDMRAKLDSFNYNQPWNDLKNSTIHDILFEDDFLVESFVENLKLFRGIEVPEFEYQLDFDELKTRIALRGLFADLESKGKLYSMSEDCSPQNPDVCKYGFLLDIEPEDAKATPYYSDLPVFILQHEGNTFSRKLFEDYTWLFADNNGSTSYLFVDMALRH